MGVMRRSWARPLMAAVILALGVPALTACGGNRLSRNSGVADREPAIAVNAYLWRATLDTLAFMPLASADPYGGVIITDWYVNPEQPNERFKITVYILDARLRADGLNVAVFKQNKGADGQWIDAPSASQTETDLENSIL